MKGEAGHTSYVSVIFDDANHLFSFSQADLGIDFTADPTCEAAATNHLARALASFVLRLFSLSRSSLLLVQSRISPAQQASDAVSFIHRAQRQIHSLNSTEVKFTSLRSLTCCVKCPFPPATANLLDAAAAAVTPEGNSN